MVLYNKKGGGALCIYGAANVGNGVLHCDVKELVGILGRSHKKAFLS